MGQIKPCLACEHRAIANGAVVDVVIPFRLSESVGRVQPIELGVSEIVFGTILRMRIGRALGSVAAIGVAIAWHHWVASSPHAGIVAGGSGWSLEPDGVRISSLISIHSRPSMF